jgi:hypothetical protein
MFDYAARPGVMTGPKKATKENEETGWSKRGWIIPIYF